jgi:hypothetical protein
MVADRLAETTLSYKQAAARYNVLIFSTVTEVDKNSEDF